MAKGRYQEWLTDEGLVLLRGWKRSGLSDEKIAENIGVSYSTFRDWKARFPPFSAALKKGKRVCDFEAEETLASLFQGHYVTDTTTEITELPNGGRRKYIKKTERWVEPNVTALIFYLKCRAGWKEQREEDYAELYKVLNAFRDGVKKDAAKAVVEPETVGISREV